MPVFVIVDVHRAAVGKISPALFIHHRDLTEGTGGHVALHQADGRDRRHGVRPQQALLEGFKALDVAADGVGDGFPAGLGQAADSAFRGPPYGLIDGVQQSQDNHKQQQADACVAESDPVERIFFQKHQLSFRARRRTHRHAADVLRCADRKQAATKRPSGPHGGKRTAASLEEISPVDRISDIYPKAPCGTMFFY